MAQPGGSARNAAGARSARAGQVVSGLLLLALAAGAGAQEPLSLAAAVGRALDEAPAARIARLEAGQADDAATAARSVYWPRAAISSQAGWSNQQDETIDVPDVDGTGHKRYPLSTFGSSEPWLAVYVEQVLFDLRQWRLSERSALEAEAAAVGEAEQREGISFAVLDRYLEVVRLEAFAAVAAERVRAAEALDRQALVLLDAGRALPSERQLVALDVEQAQLDAEAAGAELTVARDALARAIGLAPGAPLRVDPASLPAVRTRAGSDAAGGIERAPELRILALRRRMEDLSLDAARAGRYPTLSMRGGYFHYGTRRFDAFEQEIAVGFDLQVPVFDGFRTSATIAGAAKAAEAARLRYAAAEADKRARVDDLARRVRAAVDQHALAVRRVAMARERLRLADLALQGQRGSLAVALAARLEATRDARAAADAEAAAVRAWATLQRERGALADALVGAPPAAAAE